jgi:hypothetical protein
MAGHPDAFNSRHTKARAMIRALNQALGVPNATYSMKGSSGFGLIVGVHDRLLQRCGGNVHGFI